KVYAWWRCAPRVTTVPHCDAGCRKPSTTPWSRSSDFLTRVLVHGLSMQSPSPPEWSSRHSVLVGPKGEGTSMEERCRRSSGEACGRSASVGQGSLKG